MLTVGIVPAVVFVTPVYMPVIELLTYPGEVPEIVPQFAALNVNLALCIAIFVVLELTTVSETSDPLLTYTLHE